MPNHIKTALDCVDKTILSLVADGYLIKQIGPMVKMQPSSVTERLSRVYRILGVKNNCHALATAFRKGLLK